MSDESKPYPASELKLERLRAEGVIPYSIEVDTAAVLLGFFIAVLLLTGFSAGLLAEFSTAAFSYSANEEIAQQSEVRSQMSEGVSLALTTTQIGLVLAVPAALFERILAGRCERLLQHDLDELHEAWIPVASERSRGAA